MTTTTMTIVQQSLAHQLHKNTNNFFSNQNTESEHYISYLYVGNFENKNSNLTSLKKKKKL